MEKIVFNQLTVEITRKCNMACKTVITATQMLEHGH